MVEVLIGVTETRAEALRREREEAPGWIRGLTALIDTGSDSVALDSSYAEQLKLPFHGVSRMHTVFDIKYPAQFEIGIRIPFEQHELFYAEVQGSCFNKLKEACGVDVIIGRDVLRTLKLLYDGPSNTFTLFYEQPRS